MFVKVDAVVLSRGHFFFVVLDDSSTRSKSLCNIKRKKKKRQNKTRPRQKEKKERKDLLIFVFVCHVSCKCLNSNVNTFPSNKETEKKVEKRAIPLQKSQFPNSKGKKRNGNK